MLESFVLIYFKTFTKLFVKLFVPFAVKRFGYVGYVAYFCLKPSDCFQCKDLFGGLSDFCPHKKLIKRWYTNPNATFEESFTFTINNYSENQVKSDIESYSSQSFDKILASNVMAFSAVKNTNTLDYSIKVFKPNVNQTRVTNKDIEDSIKAFYALPEKVSGTDADNYFKTFNSANIDPISAYVLQINSTIVPLN